MERVILVGRKSLIKVTEMRGHKNSLRKKKKWAILKEKHSTAITAFLRTFLLKNVLDTLSVGQNDETKIRKIMTFKIDVI